MVATECLARTATALHNRHAWLQIHEIQYVWPRLRKLRISGNLLVEHVLDCVVADRVVERRLRDGCRADALAMSNVVAACAVLAKLIHEWTGQDVVKEGVDLGCQLALRRRPRRPPEDRKHLDAGQ